ncbi:MAG: bifunctional DNA-formamidopyrimidine glycosylase/DNA-(apurinic or apyrimidinic site) lyase [Firmicutes bacterium]|nr:bifunctional DNA-formamidopyrimidine glycosylase/DNA-(apurinic or apyrimidinic site) lyase [Alicyclobacillaceae bacterium]MCL6496551.1 bifunctional DNA-formamidopyrimidine glycosylase/DNA-(apurinic or apyrimidinic site) lyase [Bacillota bacterium]
MPELPEVETIRRYLDQILAGRRIDQVVHLDPRMVRGGAGRAETIVRRVTGAVVRRVGRRGKYLWMALTRPGGYLVIHLGMSGRLTWEADPAEPWRPHTHLVLSVAGGGHLRLADPRRFGRVDWAPDRTGLEAQLGVEPLGRAFTAAYLAERLAGRRAPIKALLLDQRIVAGLGNIYADEALFLCRVHPATPGGRLVEPELHQLVRAVRTVLRRSLRHRGTSFSDYVDALGHPGEHQHHLAVYGRGGQPCPRCGAPVAVLEVGGRSSHFCPRCQRPKDDAAAGPGGEKRETQYATV